MKFLVFFVCFVRVIASRECLDFDIKIVSSFLKFNNLRSGICFYCRKLSENWFKIIKNEFVHMSYFDVSNNQSFKSHKLFKVNQPSVGVIFDTTSNETRNMFEIFSTSRYFNSSYSWLMFADDFNASTQLLSSQDINLDAEITLAVALKEDLFDLFEVYNSNSRTNGQLVINSIGQWTKENGYNITKSGTKFERRSNLNGAVYRAVVIAHLNNTTLIPYLEKEDKLFDVPHRFNYNLFKILQQNYNFRYLDLKYFQKL